LQASNIVEATQSLEAQLDSLKECLKGTDWDRLEKLAESISRTASYVATIISIAKLQAQAKPAQEKAFRAVNSQK